MTVFYDRIAGILTRRSAFRRFSDAGRPTVLAHLFLVLLPVVGGAAVPAADDAGDGFVRQPVDDITQAAEDYLRQRIEGTGRQVTPRAGQLDPRLRLPLCGTALQAYLRQGSKIDSRTVVGVRCTGRKPWKVYVPVDVLEMRTVLVARRSLPRDHRLLADDLVAEERDVSRIPGGYFTEPGDLIGQRLKRRLVSGSAITPPVLKEQIVVQRGQTVILVVRNASMNVRMAGTALMDGSLNQRIRVENTVSARVVEGIVRSPQYVEVLVQ